MSRRPNDSTGFTRRDVNFSLLATAISIAVGDGRAPRSRPLHLFDFAIAGGFFYGLPAALERIRIGTALRIARELDNPFDSDAVAVHLEEDKLGFVPRAANTPIARLIDRGERVAAEVIRLLAVERDSEIPEGLVFTGFASGDPMIRLVLMPKASR